MNKKLLKEIKEYIEITEEQIDGEWGSCRNYKQLIKDGRMPDLYFKILEEIKLLPNEVKLSK